MCPTSSAGATRSQRAYALAEKYSLSRRTMDDEAKKITFGQGANVVKE
jgi:hypothetical protein